MTSLSKDASVDKPEVFELEDVGLPVESNAPGVPGNGQTPHFENKVIHNRPKQTMPKYLLMRKYS